MKKENVHHIQHLDKSDNTKGEFSRKNKTLKFVMFDHDFMFWKK
jgi:hypothetical protein